MNQSIVNQPTSQPTNRPTNQPADHPSFNQSDGASEHSYCTVAARMHQFMHMCCARLARDSRHQSPLSICILLTINPRRPPSCGTLVSLAIPRLAPIQKVPGIPASSLTRAAAKPQLFTSWKPSCEHASPGPDGTRILLERCPPGQARSSTITTGPMPGEKPPLDTGGLVATLRACVSMQ